MEERRSGGLIPPAEAGFAREMLRRIAFIRAFETRAWSLTQATPPRVAGSMHFCAGQEAVPLGAVAALRGDDPVIATYRGHGWALACGLEPGAVMGEICHKASGLNGGRAGSAFLMAPHTRFVGENSVVGAGTTIACGMALASLAARSGRVVVVTIGDGAMNQGAVHEALAFAAARSLPVIFVVENNGWSELTPTHEMFRLDRLARRGAAYGIPASTIDGTDPLIVRDSFAIAARQVRSGDGPCLIECRVPRLWGHYHRDVEHYRPKADKQAAEASDPLRRLAERLVRSDIMTQAGIDALLGEQESLVEALTAAVLESPDPSPDAALHHVAAPPAAAAAPAAAAPPAAAPPAAAAAAAAACVVLETREMTYIEAVNAALRAELEADDRTVVYGEDVGRPGGVFGATRNLQKEFGPDRVFDTPIAENAILGSAVGAALAGMRPIVEVMWIDFLLVALDQLVNQAANVRYVTGGRCSAPLVVRTQQGATPGSCAQHSQSLEALLAHIPGLKVAVAAFPQDAYALIRAAAADPDPCVVIESRALYAERGAVRLTSGAEPVGKARLLRDGADVGIVTWGTMAPRALAAATLLEAADVRASVLDLRWLNPLDEEALVALASRVGGAVLIVHEAVRTGGFAGEIAMRLAELTAGGPALTVRRLTTPDVRMPASPVLQNALLPSARAIADAARSVIEARARWSTGLAR